MNFKIDTKEKFTEITILETHLSANMTDDLSNLFNQVLESPVKNMVLSLQAVLIADTIILQKIASMSQLFYEGGNSFVICEVDQAVTDLMEELDVMDTCNVTPTISEAWDMVQMEEIERELLKDF